ncbi:MAG TPA: succinylglutamate desuccinylase/aspartoacylase family protein [bacterium]
MGQEKKFIISDAEIEPGENREIYIKISEFFTATPATIPVSIFRGKEDGPVLLVTAAVHGDELNGVGIVRKLIYEMNHEKLSGTLVCVPILNRFGFLMQSRYLPDRRDLNRFFPGKSTGSMAERICYIIFNEIIKKCDYGIDLHTAAADRTNTPHIRADISNEKTAQIARFFGAEIIIDHKGVNGSLRREAVEAGIPFILFEAGEPQKFERELIRKGYEGIFNVLAGLRMIDKTVKKPQHQIIIKESEWIRAEKGGMVDILKHPGEFVEEGEDIAVITNPFGKEIHLQKAPFAGLFLSVTTTPLVSPGMPLCNLGKFERSMHLIEKYGE